MSGQPFFSKLVKEMSATEELIGNVFNLDKKATGLTLEGLKEKAGSKSDMASWMLKLTAQLQKNLSILKGAISEVETARNESKDSLKKVCELQNKALNVDRASEQQIHAIGNVVEQKMQSTMMQYSDVLTKEVPVKSVLTISNIKSAVRQVIKTSEIDRSKNVIIFGLEEDTNEDVAEKVQTVLNAVNLKPKVSSTERFGRTQVDKIRPIKVTFETTEAVHEVLKSSKSLKSTPDLKHVFVTADRSEEQQTRHKKLVQQLRDKIREHPNKHWYIKNNSVKCSEETSPVSKEIVHENAVDEEFEKKLASLRASFSGLPS